MKKKSGKARAFIGFKLPGVLIMHLETIQRRFRKQGFTMKWVRSCNMHLTVRFLGNVPVDDFDEIARIVQETSGGYLPALMYVKGMGVFPDIRRPRVLWAGMEGQKDVLDLFYRELDQKLAMVGLPQDSRPFKAHVTLARIKKKINGRMLGRIIHELSGYQSPCFSLDTPHLFHSRLTPSGPVYTIH